MPMPLFLFMSLIIIFIKQIVLSGFNPAFTSFITLINILLYIEGFLKIPSYIHFQYNFSLWALPLLYDQSESNVENINFFQANIPQPPIIKIVNFVWLNHNQVPEQTEFVEHYICPASRGITLHEGGRGGGRRLDKILLHIPLFHNKGICKSACIFSVLLR